MPGRDERSVRTEARELGAENGEIGEDAHDDDVVFVASEAAAERREHTGGEIEGFRDRAAVVRVQVGCGRDRAEGHSLVGNLFGPVPEMPTIDGDVVALVSEAGTDLVDAFFCTTCHERINNI